MVMANRFCVSSVVSANYFQFFIPLFVTSARLAYPKCGIKIFVKGEVDDVVRSFVGDCLYENQWPEIRKRKSTHNALRHLVDPKHYHGYDCIWPGDIDFIILPHKVSHADYYMNMMDKCHLPYAAARGPMKGYGRPSGVKAWDGPFTRVAAGCSMYKHPDFYHKTKRAREYYLRCLREDKPDKFDKLKPASYREFDEVMIYRMLRMSRLKTPDWKNFFPNHDKMHPRYRDIHLGDFKFPRRYGRMWKMKRILTNENIKRFTQLEEKPEWQKAVKLVEDNCEEVTRLLKKLRAHVEKRLRK